MGHNNQHCKDFGLLGSLVTTQSLSEPVNQQLVLEQLAKDPLNQQGPCLIKEGLAIHTVAAFTHNGSLCIIILTIMQVKQSDSVKK
jgi:hypothetical protein